LKDSKGKEQQNKGIENQDKDRVEIKSKIEEV